MHPHIFGELAERSKAVVLKTIVAAMSPGVRIPHSPPLNPEKSGFFRFRGKRTKKASPEKEASK